jgi:hypothetical protein
MANVFDQFDAQQQKQAGNVFDQFDTSVTAISPEQQQQAIDSVAQEQGAFDTALISAGKGFADILRGVGLMEDADDVERRAFEALKKARPVSATVGEIAGQAAPFIAAGGPLIAGIASTGGRVAASAGLGAVEGGVIAKGQGEDVGRGALMGAAFGGGGQAIGEGVDIARRMATKAPVPEAVEYASSRGAPIMTTDVVPPQSALGRGARNIGEQIPVVGTSGARSAQQSARIAEVESLKEIYPEVTDDAIYNSFIRSGNNFKAATGKRYEAIGNAMGETEIPIDKTIGAINEEIAALTKGGRIQDRATISKLQSVLEDIASGPQTYQSMRDNRTFVRETLRSEMPSTQADRVIDRVYNAMTDDITKAVADNAGLESAAKLKQVDAIFAAEKNAQKKTKLRNILAKGDVKPEEATKAIFSSDLSDVKQAYAALDNKGRSIARAAIVNKMIEQAGSAGDSVSPEKFISAMNRYDKQFGVFFKGAERKQLQGLKAYLDATRRAAQSAVDPQTGARLTPYALTGGIVSDASGATAGLATATFATIGALSRAYESGPVRSAMIRLANTPKGGEAYQKALNAVNSALVAQQANQEKEE